MGSNFSRNLRDIFDAAGCDGIAPLDTSQSDVDGAFNCVKNSIVQQTNPRPVTPVPHRQTRLLGQDPRSPSFGIVRTPIEVTATPDSSSSKRMKKVENSINAAEKNYLETDLDSFDDVQADPSTPELSANHRLPPGLSASHFLKLKFLGIDPRSPSEGIIRTPIQVLSHEKQLSDEYSQEILDTSSLSLSRSLFGSSEESVNISKACSEPSAIVSDYEQSKEWGFSLGLNEEEEREVNIKTVEESESAENEVKNDNFEEKSSQSSELEESVSSENSERMKVKRDKELAKEIALLAEKISQTPISTKPHTGIHIFCEDLTRTPHNTPKKKSTRTPLTPICNLTPNDVSRGKKTQGKRLDKEKLVCKVLSACENTTTKQTTCLVKKGKMPFVDENAKLGDWDHDTSIII